MRALIGAVGLLAGSLILLAHSPSMRVSAQGKYGTASQTAVNKVDPQKEAQIRELMEVTGAKDLGQQLIQAGLEQFRSSVEESQPNNPRAKQFMDAFAAKFQKHFDPKSLNEQLIPIYDRYLNAEDLKGLLDYYRSPLGQRMLKALPELSRESQATGFALGQKAAQETMEELKAEFPEFVPGDEEKHPGSSPQ
jgi:hypothetical protein